MGKPYSRSRLIKVRSDFSPLGFWLMGLVIDMCNVFGTLHGACAAYIIDPYVSYSSKVFFFF